MQLRATPIQCPTPDPKPGRTTYRHQASVEHLRGGVPDNTPMDPKIKQKKPGYCTTAA